MLFDKREREREGEGEIETAIVAKSDGYAREREQIEGNERRASGGLKRPIGYSSNDDDNDDDDNQPMSDAFHRSNSNDERWPSGH